MDRRQLLALGLGAALLAAAWLVGFGSYVTGGGEFAAVHRVVLTQDGQPAPKGSAHAVVAMLEADADAAALRALVEEEVRAVLQEEGAEVGSLDVRLVAAPADRPPDAVIRAFRSDYRWSMTWPWGRERADVEFELYLGSLRGEPATAQVVELDVGGRWTYRGPAGFPGAALERVQDRVIVRTRARIRAGTGFDLAPGPALPPGG